MEVLCVVVFLIFSLLHVNAQCNYDEGGFVYFPGQSPYHQTGSQNGDAWTVTVQDQENAYLTFGPFQANVSSLYSRVDFLLSIDNNNADDVWVLQLDVNDAEVQQSLISKSVHRTDFAAPNTPQNFSLFFANQRCSNSIEFRVYYTCCAEITHYQTVVRNLDDGEFGPFWNQQAHFEFVSETNRSVAGAFIYPLNGVWYFFYREQGYEPVPDYCTGVGLGTIFRIVVATSTDQGVTWSDPVVVAEPVPGTYSECGLVDGSPFFDADTNTFHYLSQCIARSGGWAMCHFYLGGSNPLAQFTPNAANPVVKGGQLWSQICSGAGSHCTETTIDEGTPDIVEKVNGLFYVTFHGFDYVSSHGYRGVAATPDFVNWNVASYDMPDDAIFSSIDCQNWNISWNGGCIGGGEGTVLISGDYYYQIIEAPDITLGCITKLGVQNWVIGLVRSPYFSPSGTWEEFAVNPLIIPRVMAGCSLQYHRLFYDDSNGNIYLSFIIANFETNVADMQIYVMTPGYESLPIVADPTTPYDIPKWLLPWRA